jgi:hypothetical protein
MEPSEIYLSLASAGNGVGILKIYSQRAVSMFAASDISGILSAQQRHRHRRRRRRQRLLARQQAG